MDLKTFDATFRPYPYIVIVKGEPDLAQTQALAEHLNRPGATVPRTWEGHPVVDLMSARVGVASSEGDRYDPWTRTLLTPTEASAWRAHPGLLEAAHWGVETGPPEWEGGRWPKARSLLWDAQQGYPGVEALLKAFERALGSQQAAARERATRARPTPATPPPGSSGSSSINRQYDLRKGVQMAAFADLLVSCYNGTGGVHDFSRFLGAATETAAILDSLPHAGGTVALKTYIWGAVEALGRSGLVDDRLFDRLVAALPFRAADINTLRNSLR